jgi:hypothetical protein
MNETPGAHLHLEERWKVMRPGRCDTGQSWGEEHCAGWKYVLARESAAEICSWEV